MGCRKFRNYKNILHVSRDGAWIDGGEFPPSLGSFATIPKAKRGKLLDRSRYRYLDAVHMDIAFGTTLVLLSLPSGHATLPMLRTQKTH